MTIYSGTTKLNGITHQIFKVLVEDYIDTFKSQEDAFLAIVMGKRISKEISNELLSKFHPKPDLKYSIRTIEALCNRLNRLYFRNKVRKKSLNSLLEYAIVLCGCSSIPLPGLTIKRYPESIRKPGLNEDEIRKDYRKGKYSFMIRKWEQEQTISAFGRPIKINILRKKNNGKLMLFRTNKRKDEKVYREMAEFHGLL